MLTPGPMARFPPGEVSQRALPGRGGRNAALRAYTLAVACLLCLAGCTPLPEGVRPSTGRFGDITRAELDMEAFTSAYHAVERLRRSWLRSQGGRTPTNPDPRPWVYVDGVRLGSIQELYGISPEYVQTISLLSPTDATTRFGTGHVSGAIMVVTRRGPPTWIPSGRPPVSRSARSFRAGLSPT